MARPSIATGSTGTPFFRRLATSRAARRRRSPADTYGRCSSQSNSVLSSTRVSSRFALATRVALLFLAQCAGQVKTNQAHELIVLQLGQTRLLPTRDDRVGAAALGGDEGVDALLDRAAADE